jgi:adenine deaminase
MATINAAECYRLYDRGGIAPGLRADLVLTDSLKDFRVRKVFIKGELAAEDGLSLPRQFGKGDDSALRSTFQVRDFSVKKLILPLSSDEVFVIEVNPGSVVTPKGRAKVKRNEAGEFVYESAAGIAKIAVVERHTNTGNVGLGLIRGYGIRRGAS